LEFQKEKKRPYNLFEQIVFSDLQMLVCFHGDTNFFCCFQSLWLMSTQLYCFLTHTKYLSQEFVWPTRQWCVDGQLPRTYQQIQYWPTTEGKIVPKT